MKFLSDRRSNPTVGGEDLTQAGQVAVGIAASGYVANKVLTPLLSSFWSGMTTANNPAAQGVNAICTFAAGFVIAHGLKFAGLTTFAKNVRFGAAVYATAKLISIPIKDFALDSKFPEIPGISGFADRWNPKQLAPAGPGMPAMPVASLIRQSPTGL